jgi:hypothetical protein
MRERVAVTGGKFFGLTMPRLSFGVVYACLMLFATFVGVLLWQINTPLCSDDYVYSLAPTYGEYSDYAFWWCEGGEYTSADEVWRGIAGHALESNTRLTNLLYILVGLLPLPVVKTICGLSVWLMYASLMFYALGRRGLGRPWLVLLATAAFWFVFPWWDTMQSSDFIFNYPLVSVLFVLWLYYYRRIDGFGGRGLAVFFVATGVLSLFHEGFTVPLCIYVFMDAILRKGSRRARLVRVGLCVVLAAGLLTIAALGSRGRIDSQNFTLEFYMQQLVWDRVKLVSGLLPCLLAITAIFVARVFGRGIPRTLFRHELWPCVAAMVGVCAMCVVLSFYSRAAWGGEIFAYIAFIKLCAFIRVGRRAVRMAARVVCVVSAAVYAWWFAELVYWQRAVTRSHEALADYVAPRRSLTCDIAYASMVHADDIPFYLNDIPAPVEEVQNFNNATFTRYWGRKGSRVMLFLPERFKGISPDSLPVIPGNARFRGDYPYLFFDRPYNGLLRIKGGEYREGHNPLMKILNVVKTAVFVGVDNVINPYVEANEILMPDSTVRYMVIAPIAPRTFRHREIIEIDTVGNMK